MSLFAGVALLVMIFFIMYQRIAQRATHQPTFISERIPFLSHAIGIGRYGALYYKHISDKTTLPIFGLRVLSQRFYVVTDLRLISIVQRHARISFDPFVLLAAERLCGASKSMLQTMNAETEDGKKTCSSLMNESHNLLHSIFGSKSNLTGMVGNILNVVSSELPPTEPVELFSWIRHTVCLANTNVVYGPKNPFRVNPHMEKAFWDFDADLSMLLLNLLPAITARRGYRAQKELRKAFAKYFESGGADEASEFVRACNEANLKRGVSAEDRAGFQMVYCIGFLVNTPPTLFWMLFHVYSNPVLLQRLRAEVSTAAMAESNAESAQDTLDYQKLTENCPQLQAALKEVLRFHASSLSTRIVLEDTSIGNGILLNKGGIIHIPSKCLHYDEKHFSSHVDTFDPTRFLGAPQSKAQTAFRPFGGGSTLCPGRHFATMQILSITALILLKYDVIPEDGSWTCPMSLQSTMTTTVLPPVDTVRVRFQPWRG